MIPEEYADEYELRRQKIESLEAIVLAASIAINEVVKKCCGGSTPQTDLFHKLQSIHSQRFNTLHYTQELP